MTGLADLIRHDPPLRTGATAVYPHKHILEKRYRFTSRYDDEVLLHRVDGQEIHLPRALCPVGAKDERSRGVVVAYPKQPEPRDYQTEVFEATFAFLAKGQSGIVNAYTGWGKCLAPNEPVIMFDGQVRKTKELVAGDLLMGPDSKPRMVRATNPGRGLMYRIMPKRGEPFECNDAHILSLRCTSDCFYGDKGQLVSVPLSEWLTWPQGKKHVYKLWRAAVDFPQQKQRIDPYFLGVLLGDGSTQHSIGVTSMDQEIVEEVYRQAAVYGSKVTRTNANTGLATTYFLRERRGNGNRCALRLELYHLGLQVPCGKKFIPRGYKVASREQRLQLLAGLLDTDGYLNARTVFEITCKSPRLGEDIAFLARSLGFGVSTGEKADNGVIYSRLTIYGDTHMIPTRLPRKQASARRQIKDPLVTGFKVEALGEGDWFGIEISGDHLYLLADFTVTHNTALGFGAAAYLGVKTLVVATKDDIFKQWIDGACGQNGEPDFLGLPRDRIGVIRGDKCEIAGKDFVVAMIHTLAKRQIPQALADEFGLVIFDEVHRVPADSFQVAASMFPAFWRLGMSADETRADGKELLIYAHIGPVRAATEAQLMVPKVLRYRSAWECPRVVRENPEEPGTKHVVRLPHEPGKTTHIEKILAADPKRNELLATLVKTAFDAGRKIVVFSTLRDHLRAIHRAAVKQGMSGKAFGYYLGAQTKADKEEREKQKGRPILLTTYSMMGEGTNIPWLDCGIQAIPRANVEQPCGRIRRDHPDKRPPVWMDVADSDSPVFTGYSSSRMTWYRSIGCEIHDMN